MTRRERQHFGHHVGITDIELVTVNPAKGDDREEADALVAITIRMVPRQLEAVSRGQRGDVLRVRISPLVLRPGKG